MINKKGAVEIQFTFIFMFIAGAAILMFFFSFAFQEKDNAKIEIDQDILTRLDTILKGASVLDNSLIVLDGMPSGILEFSCYPASSYKKKGEISYYSLGQARTDLPISVIFAPKEIQVEPGRGLIINSLDFNVPFTVSHSLYLTSSYIKYIFVDDNSLIKSLYDDDYEISMPNNISKELVTIANLSSEIETAKKKFEKVVIVYNYDSISFPLNYANLYYIGIDKKTDKHGEIYFNNKYGIENLEYLTRSQIIGAIFSADHESYECNVQKQQRLLKNNLIILNNKTQYLLDENLPPICNSLYLEIQNKFNNVQSHNLELNKIDSIFFDYSDSLESKVNALISASCPSVFEVNSFG